MSKFVTTRTPNSIPSCDSFPEALVMLRNTARNVKDLGALTKASDVVSWNTWLLSSARLGALPLFLILTLILTPILILTLALVLTLTLDNSNSNSNSNSTSTSNSNSNSNFYFYLYLYL